jgi:hypothetical protein
MEYYVNTIMWLINQQGCEEIDNFNNWAPNYESDLISLVTCIFHNKRREN